MIDKNNYNNIFQRHGYWEGYWFSNNIMMKGNFNNGKEIGYWEWYYSDGKIKRKEYYL